MQVSFIGMSNIGKSAWAQRIAASSGLTHFNCDALIEKELGDEIIHTGAKGARNLANWMGQPFNAGYRANSRRYLDCEKIVLENIFQQLRGQPKLSAVIDTTGSVIYADAGTLAELRNLTRIIYFEASEQHMDVMLRNYIANPKPVIWGDLYASQANETSQQTLERCYPLLLHERILRYKELAHITIPFEIHKNHKMDMYEYLQGLGV